VRAVDGRRLARSLKRPRWPFTSTPTESPELQEESASITSRYNTYDVLHVPENDLLATNVGGLQDKVVVVPISCLTHSKNVILRTKAETALGSLTWTHEGGDGTSDSLNRLCTLQAVRELDGEAP
jgi:hypothetical protein